METFWGVFNSKKYSGLTISDIDVGIKAWKNIDNSNNINHIPSTSGFPRSFLISILKHCQNARDDNMLMLTKYVVETHGASVVTLIDHPCSQPLYWAVYHGLVETSRYLISKGARVNVHIKDSIIQSIVNGLNYNMLCMLIENGANVNEINIYKQTPLKIFYSMYRPHMHKNNPEWHKIEFLLKNGLNASKAKQQEDERVLQAEKKKQDIERQRIENERIILQKKQEEDRIAFQKAQKAEKQRIENERFALQKAQEQKNKEIQHEQQVLSQQQEVINKFVTYTHILGQKIDVVDDKQKEYETIIKNMSVNNNELEKYIIQTKKNDDHDLVNITSETFKKEIINMLKQYCSEPNPTIECISKFTYDKRMECCAKILEISDKYRKNIEERNKNECTRLDNSKNVGKLLHVDITKMKALERQFNVTMTDYDTQSYHLNISDTNLDNAISLSKSQFSSFKHLGQQISNNQMTLESLKGCTKKSIFDQKNDSFIKIIGMQNKNNVDIEKKYQDYDTQIAAQHTSYEKDIKPKFDLINIECDSVMKDIEKVKNYNQVEGATYIKLALDAADSIYAYGDNVPKEIKEHYGKTIGALLIKAKEKTPPEILSKFIDDLPESFKQYLQ